MGLDFILVIQKAQEKVSVGIFLFVVD